MSQRRLLRLIVPVVSVVLTLLLAEGAARVAARMIGKERLIVFDRRLGWKLAPGVRKWQQEDELYFISVNSHGLRDDETAFERRPGERRMLVLGDSFAFGYGGVDAEERFSEVIEARRPNLEVINSGVTAYEPVQELFYLQDSGLRYQPDLVLLALFANDFTLCFRPFDHMIGRPKAHISLEGGELAFHEPEFGWPYLITQHSFILGVIDNYLSLRYDWRPPMPPEMTDADKDAAYRLLIALIAEEARSGGARFAVVYFPARSRDRGENRRIPSLVSTVAEQEGFTFLDLTEDVLRDGGDRSRYFKNDPHFNAEGHRFAGEAIDREIVGPLLYGESAGDGAQAPAKRVY